jgi:hypothetical protein
VPRAASSQDFKPRAVRLIARIAPALCPRVAAGTPIFNE